MQQIDRSYVSLGLAWLAAGMILGLYMGKTGDLNYLRVHTTMLLGGFVVLTTYGILYRLWPAMKEGALPKVQYWGAVIAVFAMVVGAVLDAKKIDMVVLGVGASLATLSAILMGWLFWTRSAKA